jgi:hypothetical protein
MRFASNVRARWRCAPQRVAGAGLELHPAINFLVSFDQHGCSAAWIISPCVSRRTTHANGWLVFTYASCSDQLGRNGNLSAGTDDPS